MADRDRDRLHALLRGALDQPPEARDRWADQACGGNAVLRARLGVLLRAVHEETEQHTPADLQLLGDLRTPTPAPATGTPAPSPLTPSPTPFPTPTPLPTPTPGGGFAPAPHSGSTASGDLDMLKTPPRLSMGQHLGRYQIIDLLGAGGMGTVYRALDTDPRTRSRDQGAGPRLPRRFGQPAPLRARSARPRRDEPSEHRGHLRPRTARRLAVSGPRARRRRNAGASHRARPAPLAGSGRDRDPDHRRSRRGARQGRHPSRPEAVERDARAGRPRQAARLRPRQDRGAARGHRASPRRSPRPAPSSAPRAT